ncbi:hypothetical protein EB796_001149 [Bugula neritina]|uniref:Uncharacterized protein n=1 Tax=Bugula neritina TaxID=10212 RepID=A0A7J7KQS0_BUGNE|nr:hypothetical protein EB796_001149 [Bugula neritina]
MQRDMVDVNLYKYKCFILYIDLAFNNLAVLLQLVYILLLIPTQASNSCDKQTYCKYYYEYDQINSLV